MSLSQPPRFSLETAHAILRDLYGIDGTVSLLPSERDQNFRVDSGEGRGYVLKIANRAEIRAMLEAENAAIERAAASGVCPMVIAAVDGSHIIEFEGHLVRLITLLPGQAMGALKRQSPALLADLGRALGRLSAALAGFDHPAVHRDFHWDLAKAEPIVAEFAGPAPVQKLLENYRRYAKSLLPELRQSVIHNDANDFNVIAGPGGECVSGIVDFGDMVFTHTVNEVAIAMAYAALGKPDPLAAMVQVAGAYHSEFPLREAELEALYSLACMRLCVSASLAAKQQAARPDDPYLGISQQPIQAVLPRLAAIHPRLACYLFRHACGLEPVPWSPMLTSWLRDNQHGFASIVEGVDLTRDAAVTHLDLSVESPLVSGDLRRNAPQPLAARLVARIRQAGGILGAGGYDEARMLYAAPEFQGNEPFEETRSIHLGVDLTLEPGTRVCAFAEATVHAFEDANHPLDYGPVVVLEHDAGPTKFYTLYGHLSRASLAVLRLGQRLAKGEPFAAIGTAAENGGWWPHLHFQIVTDMLDVACNYNGCALPSQREVWKGLCPDPNLILRIPALSRESRKPGVRELAAERARKIGSNLSVSYGENPVQAARGWMQYLYDADGRKYLDAYNNVPHVGHCHPRVVEAGRGQLAVLNTNTRYLQRQLTDYAEALTSTLPPELSVCFFVASGSEANELALRIARSYTGAKDLLVMDAAYHGHTSTLIDISPYKHEGPGGHGAPDWVHKTPIPDVYRGMFKAQDPRVGHQYAQQVAEAIDRIKGRPLCGYIAETCPSVAGQILLPPGFLSEVYGHVRKAGGLCIADEVQTGFGRMGSHFWAFEAHGVIPDIVVLGKPIANGYPMGAVICRPEIARAFDNGMEFFSTFGGSTAALAAAHATLDVTLEEGLQAIALAIGERLLAGLRAIGHPLIGDVRGSGMFAGVELVRDRHTLEPADREAAYVARRMRERGVLLGTDGPWHNVIKLRGPLQWTEMDVDALLAAFAATLAEL